VKVTVALTGEHTVTFDPDGKEVKWDFDTPVHENLSLKAKWKKKPEETTAKKETATTAKNTEEQKKAKEKKPKKESKTNLKYKEVADRRAQKKAGEAWGTDGEGTAQTGEESKLVWSQSEVLEAKKPVLVDFWAPWCGYCRRISPALDQIGEDQEGSVQIGKINIDEKMELAEKFGVMTIPTMILFKDGKGGEALVAAQSRDQIEKWMQEQQ